MNFSGVWLDLVLLLMVLVLVLVGLVVWKWLERPLIRLTRTTKAELRSVHTHTVGDEIGNASQRLL